MSNDNLSAFFESIDVSHDGLESKQLSALPLQLERHAKLHAKARTKDRATDTFN